METDCLMDRMGTEPILSVKRRVSIDTMVNFDGHGDGDGHGKCKQTFNRDSMYTRILLPFQAWYEPFPALVRNFQWWLKHKLSPTARLISVQSLPVKIKAGEGHFLSK